MTRKKNFDGSNMFCRFCNKGGHEICFCPVIPSVPTTDCPAGAEAFVASLRDGKEVVPAYGRCDLRSLTRHVEARAKELNEKNPWADSKERTDLLRKQLGAWRAIGAPTTVLSWIAYGVPVRFRDGKPPARAGFANGRSYWDKIEFVRTEVADLVERGALRKIPHAEAHCICPIHVVDNKGKLRVTMDTRYPNSEVCNPAFRLETLQQFSVGVLEQGMLMVTSDITKAYYSVPLHPDAQKYFCFEHEGQVYCPTTLVTGSAQAPYYFNKLLRVVTRFARAAGVGMQNYFDDHLWYADKDSIPATIEFAKWLVPHLGFVFNLKSCWDAGLKAKFLGYLVDLAAMRFTVEETKLRAILRLLSELASQMENGERVSVKLLQRVTGSLMSVQLAVPHVRVWTRCLYYEIACAGYRTVTQTGAQALKEVLYWQANLLRCNGKAIAQPKATYPLHVDASEVGWGAHTDKTECSGLFDASLCGTSSTLRELEGLCAAGKRLQDELAGKAVLVLMDSSAAIRNLINEGGPVPNLARAVRKWVEFSVAHRIVCTYEWQRRALNARADQLSKLLSHLPLLKAGERERITKMAPSPCRWALTAEDVRRARDPAERELFLLHVDYNTIRETLQICVRQRTRILLLHPVWMAQGWWADIKRHAVSHVPLGPLSDLTEPAERARGGYADWQMQLSDLDCRQR